MNTASTLPYIEPDDFARRFSLRAKNLMWFLGAGASASAGGTHCCGYDLGV